MLSDGEVLVLEIWDHCYYWLGMVVFVRRLSMGQIELFKKYFYSVRLCKKQTLKKRLFKNWNLKIQWTLFINLQT